MNGKRGRIRRLGEAFSGRRGRTPAAEVGDGGGRSVVGVVGQAGQPGQPPRQVPVRSPSSAITAGSSTARMIVASMSTATARPTPICLKSCIDSVPKIANTATMMTAALVTTPAVVRMPCATASVVGGRGRGPRGSGRPRTRGSPSTARTGSTKTNSGSHGLDRPDAVGADQTRAPAVLEDRDQHAVGGADRQQVEHDRGDGDRRASGTTISISRKVKTSTKAKTGTMPRRSWSLKSVGGGEVAGDGASAPSTLPSVAGHDVVAQLVQARAVTWRRSRPASGTLIAATFAAGVDAARRPAARTPRRCRAASCSDRDRLPYARRLDVVRLDDDQGRVGAAGEGRVDAVVASARSARVRRNSWSSVRFSVCMPSAGAASASRSAGGEPADEPGRAQHRAADGVPDPAAAAERAAAGPGTGSGPISTRSPSSDSSAGSTVTEPTMATATTIIVARPSPRTAAMPGQEHARHRHA